MKVVWAIAGVLLWLIVPAWADLIIRSAADLDAMTDAELAEQARQACSAVSACQQTRNAPNCLGARLYLDTIGQVARKHHNGQLPVWMEGFKAAATQVQYSAPSSLGACNQYSKALSGGLLKNYPTPRPGLRK